MITAESFWQAFKERNITFFSGVPCSILQNIIYCALRDPELTYIPASREDMALGIASGAHMSGKSAGILLQNSGLGNLVNPLTSFSLMCKIPVLLIITWRGYQGQDAPEHLVMGEKTLELLDVLGLPYRVLEQNNLDSAIDAVRMSMDEQQTPGALVLREGIVI